MTSIAEFLKRDIAKPKPIQARPEGGEIGAVLGHHFKLDTAAKIDAIVQAGRDEQDKRGNRKERRNADANEARPHETNACSIRDQLEEAAA